MRPIAQGQGRLRELSDKLDTLCRRQGGVIRAAIVSPDGQLLDKLDAAFHGPIVAEHTPWNGRQEAKRLPYQTASGV
jgi:hypothetical protein